MCKTLGVLLQSNERHTRDCFRPQIDCFRSAEERYQDWLSTVSVSAGLRDYHDRLIDIHSRAKAVPCDKANPTCLRRVSTKWKADIDEGAPPTPVTPKSTNFGGYHDLRSAASSLTIDQLSFTSPTVRWNERHSFHFFVNFTAPQVAGPFGSIFWQQMVIQAAYKEPAILHALIGLGSLHQGIVQSSSQTDLERHPKYQFALRHINHALKNTRTENEKDHRPPSLRMILTLCIILTTFEALQGRFDDVLKHTIQGLRLFGTSKAALEGQTGNKAVDDRPFPVTPTALTSVFAYYSSFTTAMTGMLVPVLMNAQRPLPSRFCSIAEAQLIFDDAKNAITMLFILVSRHPRAEERLAFAKELRGYRAWLERWKDALDAFTEREQTRFTTDDIRAVLILRANYLYCLIASSLDYRSINPASAAERFGKMENLLKEMVDICETVVKMESKPALPTVISTKNAYFSYGLWLTESLFIASTFSTDPQTKQRAGMILMQYPRPEALTYCGPYLAVDMLQQAREVAVRPDEFETEQSIMAAEDSAYSSLSSSVSPSSQKEVP